MCEFVEAGKVIQRTENGRAFVINNPRHRQINVVHVDGCLISKNDPSRRVDWLVDIPSDKKLSAGIASVKLIELKGDNVLYAFSQLNATMIHQNLASRLQLIDRCFIVSQQRPSLQTVVQNEVVKFKMKYGVVAQVVPKALIDVED